MSQPRDEQKLPVKSPVLVGDLVPDELNAAGALTTIVSSFRDMAVESEKQETERLKIRSDLQERLAEIASAERVLITYFDHIFPERRDSLNRLFTELDRAREAGQTDVMAASIKGIVDVATSSPLKGVFDLEQVRRELATRNVEL